MLESFFEKLKLCVLPGELIPLICESFSHKELVRLIASEGVVYPGIRMEKLRPEELASGWVKDAWKNPEVLAGLVKALDDAHARDIERIRLASLDEVARMPKSVTDICRRREISGLIWALLRDERVDAALVRRFLESFYRFLDKGAAASRKMERFEDHLMQGSLNKSETEKVRRMLTGLIEEKKELKRVREKDFKDMGKMTRQIDNLKKNTNADQAEIAALKNDLAGLRKETARKDIVIRELEDKVKTISKKEEAVLHRRIHDLERDERKYRHEIADLNDKLSAAGLEMQAADNRYQELHGAFQEERLKAEHLDEEIKRLVQQMEDRNQAGPVSVEKTSVPPKAKGRRLGVFVDTRHLRQVSRFLQQKIDYQKLLEFVVLDRHLVKAVAYVMTAPEVDSNGFIEMLKRNNFDVRCRQLVRWPDGSIHGSWDAGIVADVILLTEKLNLDIVHLVSGNENFMDLLKLLKAEGLQTEVSGFKTTTMPGIERAADEFIPFGDEILRDSA